MVRSGDRVSERYEVLEQLAVGGMGTLWRARHLELDVEVALKVISSESASETLLKRFKREAQAAARLRSPNIVQVWDYGVFQGQPYLAMELLRGEDLASRLARRGALTPEECLTILQGVANAMAVAHEAGIVHRDLKPANIFLERVGDQEVVKVLDFGVAKDLGRTADSAGTTGSAVVGSPAYMSPEQVWGEPVGRPADLWAMGVLVFEILTGRCPFADESLAKVFERIIRAPLPKARDVAPHLPASIELFFERAFARAVAERFSSARELMGALQEALEGSYNPRAANGAKSSPTAPSHTVSPFSTTQGRRSQAGVKAQSRRTTALVTGLLLAGALVIGLLSRRTAPSPPTSTAAPSARPTVVAAPTIAETASSRSKQLELPQVVSASNANATPTAEVPKRPRPRPDAVPSASRSDASALPKVDPQFGIPLPR
jgi:eukaryotic-like serine/threonine-protein kinase